MLEFDIDKVPEGKCQEASMFAASIGMEGKYVPCFQPATKLMHCSRDKRDYRMCEMCADHNLTRGMTIVKELPDEN